MNACKHSRDGFCNKCAELKPYMQFRLCKLKCFKCNECNYYWGPSHFEKNGQPLFKEINLNPIIGSAKE